MPTVRRAERQAITGALPGVRKTAAETPASEGAGVEYARADKSLAIAGFGERVTRVGAGLFARVQEEERQKANETALMKANNRLADWKAKRLYDPDRGAMAQKGENARPLPEQIQQEFDQLAGEIEAGLGNDAQRAAFQRLRSQEWQSIDLQVRRHVMGEIEQDYARTVSALVNTASNAAIQASADPKLVAVELDKARAALRTAAPRLGMSPEVLEEEIRKVESATHVGVISQLLAQGNDQGAQAYFEAARGQIKGDQVDQVTKALEEGSLRGAAQKKTDEILAAGGTLTEQREKARELEPKLRDQVLTRLEHEAAVREREEREREEAASIEGYNILDRTPDVTQIPPALWTSFSGAQRSAMRSYAEQRAKGRPIETDDATYYGLMGKAGTDPQAFLQVNLLSLRHKLGDAEFKQLTGLQLQLRQGDTRAADKTLAPWRSKAELVDDTLRLHGIDPDDKDAANLRRVSQLRRLVDRRVELLQTTTGKQPSNQDVQAEIDRILTAQTLIPGDPWSFWPGGRSFTDERKRLVDVTVAEIPASERRLIEAALKARNQPVNDQTVLDLFIEKQLAEGNR